MNALIRVAVVVGLLLLADPIPLAAQPTSNPNPLAHILPPETVAPTGQHAARSDTLSLNDALRRALSSSPTLQAIQYGVVARVAEERQAGRWPNPELEADLAEFGGSDALAGIGAAEMGMAFSQTLPLGGDVAARQRVAGQERLHAEYRRLAVQLDVIRAVTQAFWLALATQHERDVAVQQWALAQQFAATVDDRVEAGKVSPLEATRAAIDRSTARVALAQAEQAAHVARVQLGQWWGHTTPDFDGVRAEWPSPDALPPLAVLSADLLQAPDLGSAQTEIAVRKAERRLIEAERVPGPTLRAGVQRFRAIGETAFQAGLGVTLPLFDRKRGARAAADARIQQAEADVEATRVALHAQLAEQYHALHAAAFEVRTLTGDVLPAAEEVYEATLEGYREGKFDLLTLIDAQRILFDASRQQVAARLRYVHRRAEVERLIGRSLDVSPTLGTSQ